MLESEGTESAMPSSSASCRSSACTGCVRLFCARRRAT
jgi:hypothetical protein